MHTNQSSTKYLLITRLLIALLKKETTNEKCFIYQECSKLFEGTNT